MLSFLPVLILDHFYYIPLIMEVTLLIISTIIYKIMILITAVGYNLSLIFMQNKSDIVLISFSY